MKKNDYELEKKTSHNLYFKVGNRTITPCSSWKDRGYTLWQSPIHPMRENAELILEVLVYLSKS